MKKDISALDASFEEHRYGDYGNLQYFRNGEFRLDPESYLREELSDLAARDPEEAKRQADVAAKAAKSTFENDYKLRREAITGAFTAFQDTYYDELKQQIEYSQKEADRLAWFATDEGKAYKQKTEKEMETIWDELNKLKKETHNYVQEIVHKLLGNSFDVVNFGHRGFKVYMTKGYTKEDIENCHFIPSFEIYHDKLFRSDISRWILNYPSSGEFELGSDWIRTKFLVGLAKFVSDEEGLSSLIERMNSYYNQSNALEIELYRLNEELGYL
jgi:hypothetical protein